MENNENILDSGEIYKGPEEETPDYLPELELEPNKFKTVDWKPLKSGGSSFKTHQLVFKDGNTVKFEGTRHSYLFGLVFLLPGLLFLFLGMLVTGVSNTLAGLIMAGLGFLMSLIGALIVDFLTIPAIFNKRVGLYWKGRQPIFSRLFSSQSAYSVNFEDVKAVQLLKEEIKGKNGRYNSYEINLVLANNERLNVVDHGAHDTALKDATNLAEFLTVPFLNGIRN